MAMTWLEEQFADEIKELSNNLLKKETELAECKKQMDRDWETVFPQV